MAFFNIRNFHASYFDLWVTVTIAGGPEIVTDHKLWLSIWRNLFGNESIPTDASFRLKNIYTERFTRVFKKQTVLQDLDEPHQVSSKRKRKQKQNFII